jgi:hypothetical protein
LVRLEEFTDIYHQREQGEDEDIGHIAMMLSMVNRGGRSKRPTPLKPLKRKDQEMIRAIRIDARSAFEMTNQQRPHPVPI